MKGERLRGDRFLEELLLYSGQFGLFYALMQAIVQGGAFFGNFGHMALVAAIVLQSAALSVAGGKPGFRWALSFIVPLVYGSIELFEGVTNLTNAAHMGFWAYAAFSAALMTMKRAKDERLRSVVEAVLVAVNVFIYVFLYFYFDTLKDVGDPAELTVFRIYRHVGNFLRDPTHWYVIFGGVVLALTIGFGRHELHKLKNRISSLFGKYVDSGLRDTVIEKGEFTATKRELCVLFSDIVGFTVLCEKLEARQVSDMLNSYFEYWNAIVKRHGGTVDKYVGDAIMVIFGLENPERGCEDAVRCALEARSGWSSLKGSLRAKGLPVPEGFGIGCHYGELIIGDIGSEDRKNITVVGDTVNVASRLESMTRKAGKGILISDAVYGRISVGLQARFGALGSVELKGKSAGVEAWGNLGTEGDA